MPQHTASTVFRIVTTSPKAFIIHTEDEDRARMTVQHLDESFPYTDFSYEVATEFFDLPDANHFILDAVRSVSFERGIAAALKAIRAEAVA